MLPSFLFFFFKQKTAYEMRISDWSSDVCSSDLKMPDPITPFIAIVPTPILPISRRRSESEASACIIDHSRRWRVPYSHLRLQSVQPFRRVKSPRSEEHTSELQSLMRISYAVFCLKKKKRKNTTTRNTKRQLKKTIEYNKRTTIKNTNKRQLE